MANDAPTTKPPPRLRLRLSTPAESAVRAGHPWVYADRVQEQNRPGETGELAVIYDRKDAFLAAGLYDAGSPIRVRILHAGKPRPLDDAWWTANLETALASRAGRFEPATTGYRLINGESDGWPGLVLDRYATTLVLKLYTAAWLPRLDETAARIIARLAPERLVLRLSRNLQETARDSFARADGNVLHGTAPEGPVIFQEDELRFEAEVLRGQKTGFFLDQRENRRRVGSLGAGRRVLNVFSFSGGFSVHAARGGARMVTDLDISAHALASAARNFALNSACPAVAACAREAIQGDAFEWLAAATGQFDLIVLDPPSLARRETEREGAIHAYQRLAALGLQRLAPGGILLAASCSAHVTAAEFFAAVRQASARSGRVFEERETTGHAPDHPARFKEAEYLKAIYLQEKQR